MLVLSRKKGETIIIQDNIEITILDVNAETVKIGINAPREVEILRKEIHEMVKAANTEAAAPAIGLKALQEKMKKNQKNEDTL